MDLISGLRQEAAEGPVAGISGEIVSAFSLEGRGAVVTGAGKGIGREVATVLAGAGAKVVLADVDRAGLEEAAASIAGSSAVPTDVTSKSEVEDLARAALRSVSRIDVWVNVAGIIRTAGVTETSEEDLDAVIAVNLKGVYWGVAAAGRVMTAAKRGSIVNVASAGGETGAPSLGMYGSTKAGVIQLTRVAATELGPKGIRVNSVAPGFVDTPMTQRHWVGPDGTVDEAVREAYLGPIAAQSPLGVVGTTRDMALGVLYLASDASRFVTGQVLRVNGGVHMA